MKKCITIICTIAIVLAFTTCSSQNTEIAKTVGGIGEVGDTTVIPLWEYAEISKVEIILHIKNSDLTFPDPLSDYPKAITVEQEDDISTLKGIAIKMAEEGAGCNIGLTSPRYRVVFYGSDGTTQYFTLGPYVFCGDFTGAGNHIFTDETDLQDVSEGTAGEISIYREVKEIFNKYSH